MADESYEAQLAAVDAALARDPENDEWQKLRTDLLDVIALRKQLADVKGEAAGASASANAAAAAAAVAAENIRSYSIGERCQALFENDGQWYNAKVVALASDGYFVTYLGYGNTAQVEFSEVRPYVRPDTSEWRAGVSVTAIAPSDGRWYDATIVSVRPAGALVRFAGETEVTEVDVDAVRMRKTAPAPAAGSSSSGAAAGGSSEADAKGAAGVPKQMEIRPDDSEDVVARKKRKLSMYRRQEKKEKEEKAGDERRSSWQSFQKKNKTINKAKNNHDPNWDPTKDRGEALSREKQGRLFFDGQF